MMIFACQSNFIHYLRVGVSGSVYHLARSFGLSAQSDAPSARWSSKFILWNARTRDAWAMGTYIVVQCVISCGIISHLLWCVLCSAVRTTCVCVIHVGI